MNKPIYNRILLTGMLLVLMGAINANAADSAGDFKQSLQAELYGSLRLQAEYVDADNQPGNFDDYTGFRDAFSRIGFKLKFQFAEEWSALFQAEAPLDLANGEVQTAWNQDEDRRILKLQLDSPVGQLWYGQGWIAYYNYIALPLDQFSSFYSGFATFSSLRLDETVYYATPSTNRVQAAFSSSGDNGSNTNRRNQYAVSYNHNGLYLAVGMDDIGGPQDKRVLGLAASWTTGPWYIAAKYERFSSEIEGEGWAADGTDAANLLLQYSHAKHTWRAMVADVANFGETTFHAGWDYQFRGNTRFFFEYYSEQETAVIADSRQTTYPGGSNNDPADSGGQALLAGVRYDF